MIAIVNIGLLLLVAGYILVYRFGPARIIFSGGHLVKKQNGKSENIALSDLSSIQFHYHAVVGFVGTWEFVSKSGKSILVEAYGIDYTLLSRLERHVPHFSSKRFHQQFEAGDVADTLEVWKTA
jgi:hypothetical protein